MQKQKQKYSLIDLCKMYEVATTPEEALTLLGFGGTLQYTVPEKFAAAISAPAPEFVDFRWDLRADQHGLRIFAVLATVQAETSEIGFVW